MIHEQIVTFSILRHFVLMDMTTSPSTRVSQEIWKISSHSSFKKNSWKLYSGPGPGGHMIHKKETDLTYSTSQITSAKNVIAIFSSNWWKSCIFLFLAYLKSWWNVVLVFGKEHANWSNISGDMTWWSWKIKFGKIHFLCQNVNWKCQ